MRNVPFDAREQKRRHIATQRIDSEYGRNEPCPCGSGRKYKRCCQPDKPKGKRKSRMIQWMKKKLMEV